MEGREAARFCCCKLKFTPLPCGLIWGWGMGLNWSFFFFYHFSSHLCTWTVISDVFFLLIVVPFSPHPPSSIFLSIFLERKKTCFILRTAADIGNMPQLQARQQDFVEFAPCASSEPCDKALFHCGLATGNVHRKDRAGPILLCVLHCCSQSQCRQQLVRTSYKMACCAELSELKMARWITCIKSKKSPRIYPSM